MLLVVSGASLFLSSRLFFRINMKLTDLKFRRIGQPRFGYKITAMIGFDDPQRILLKEGSEFFSEPVAELEVHVTLWDLIKLWFKRK